MIKKERLRDMENFQSVFNQASIIAAKRDARPFIHEEDTNCPFCLTHEAYLESIIDESWQESELLVRIVPNRYPVTSNLGTKGYHDVVIDTGYHTLHPKDFTLSHWEVLMRTMQKRWQSLMEDAHIQFIQIFKNYGTLAGASISHSHWQIIALEEIPYSMKMKYKAYHQNDKCFLCDLSHLAEGFCIWEDSFFGIWVPPMPKFPYEVWIIPKGHYQHYGELSLEEIKRLGQLLKYLLEVYHQINPHYSFNICMMSGDVKGQHAYHFYIQLVMRKGHIAGFEIATGCHILSVEPKDYAKQMNQILKGMYK